MKRFWFSLILLSLTVASYAYPRANGFWGNATGVASTVTATFNPSGGCITDEDTTNALYANITGATAVASSGGTTWKIPAGKTQCWSSSDPNGYNAFSISLITGGSTVAYSINLYRSK